MNSKRWRAFVGQRTVAALSLVGALLSRSGDVGIAQSGSVFPMGRSGTDQSLVTAVYAPTVLGGIRPRIPALLNNDARGDQALVDAAKAEVVRLYALIEIDLIWVSEVPGPDTEQHVICLVAWEPDQTKLGSSVLGYTPARPGHRGALAYVFLRRVERSSQKFKARVDNVLAVAIAHELGHTLLPDVSHAKIGLMRASWDSIDFGLASAGLLVFRRETGDLIQRGLARQRAFSTPAGILPPPVR
jgi:hypothetical protein